MRKRLQKLIPPLAFGLVGCAAPIYPVGAIYNNVKTPSPLTQVEAQGENKAGPKQGKACATGILGLVAWGDATVDTAKKAGGITDVHTVEWDSTAVLGPIYFKACTIVTGI